jgi:hypothetical protein
LRAQAGVGEHGEQRRVALAAISEQVRAHALNDGEGGRRDHALALGAGFAHADDGVALDVPQVTAQEKMPCRTVNAVRIAAGPTLAAFRSALNPATTRRGDVA